MKKLVGKNVEIVTIVLFAVLIMFGGWYYKEKVLYAPECSVNYDSDMNVDCYVNWGDFSIFANQWLYCNDPANPGLCSEWFDWTTPIPTDCAEVQQYGYGLSADLNRDCYVNWVDFSIFANQWLMCTDVNYDPEMHDCATECIPGNTYTCGSDVGVCQTGTKICPESGEWLPDTLCLGSIGPFVTGENCFDIENLDEDCDGLSNCEDSDCFGTSEDCGIENEFGICYGLKTCSDGVWGECDAQIPEAELCDGVIDENCDGSIDEGCACIAEETKECGSDVGECEFGVQTCSLSGEWGECLGGIIPVTEICGDSKDNDCDGSIDEDCEIPAPPAPSGGSSGGGGGSSSTAKTYTLTELQFVAGATENLGTNDKFQFTVQGASHSVKLTKVTTKSATMTIASTPQTITLTIGEEKKIDLDNNGYYDLYVKLNSIKSGKADVTIKSIYEKISGAVPETSLPEEETEEEISKEELPLPQAAEKEIPVKTIAGLIIGIIALIIIIYLVMKSRKRGKSVKVRVRKKVLRRKK